MAVDIQQIINTVKEGIEGHYPTPEANFIPALETKLKEWVEHDGYHLVTHYYKEYTLWIVVGEKNENHEYDKSLPKTQYTLYRLFYSSPWWYLSQDQQQIDHEEMMHELMVNTFH